MPNKCYPFVTVLYFFRYFLRLFLITTRILRKEFPHTARKRRLVTYAQTADCHL